MRYVFELFFKPPEMPPINLPLPASLIPGTKNALLEIYKAVYERGVFDGFIAGVLVAVLVIPAVRRGSRNDT